jgi:hypothetical protein
LYLSSSDIFYTVHDLDDQPPTPNRHQSTNMRSKPYLLSLLSGASLALASDASDMAVVNVEASHGGAGQDLTNTTIRVPFISAYTNQNVLDEVSTLYLIDSIGVPIDSISCQPFRYANGSGDAGLPFNSSYPSYISTNTVEIGSIVCVTSDISFAPPGPPPGGPEPLSSSLGVGNLTRTLSSKTTAGGGGVATSTLVRTTHINGQPVTQSTETTVIAGAASSSAAAAGGTGASATASTSPTLSSDNAASGNSFALGSEFWGGLALAGFGLAFVL